MKHYKYLCFLLVFLWFAPVWSANLVENGNKLQMADEIDIQYVVPLRLGGKTGNYALEKLLNEGFRCGLVPVSTIGLNEPPRLICVQEPSAYAPLCEELFITLRLESINPPPSREEMLNGLGTIKVRSASTFCPYPPEVSADYLAQRTGAEGLLAEQVAEFKLVGNARQAYGKLLLDGFYCGFGSNSEDEPASASELVCTKKPSGIKFCFESKLVMDVEWGKAITSKSDLFKALNAAKIIGIQSSCEVPAIKSKGPDI